MTNPIALSPCVALICLAFSSPLSAAESPIVATAPTPAAAPDISTAGAADGCRADLKTFTARMEKDGYWNSGDGYGFGFPMSESGFGTYGESVYQDRPANSSIEYQGIRPGYEVRVLIDGANIMARHGQQQDCEDILAETRTLYTGFLADMQHAGKPMADGPAWRMKEIRAAVPVSDENDHLRSDALVGVEVRSPNDTALGSVDDLVMNPKTKQIAYLVIARGGIFGFDESHVPVPWKDFKTTPATSLLVLDTTKAILDGAPEVKKGSFSVGGDVATEGVKVDAYWNAHPTTKASN
jgi:sporulation protein YlmC with PRC-barrel domain